MCVLFYMAPRISITENRRKLGLTYEAGHKKGDCFGKGYATRLCVDLATAAGMDNAARCTAHGRRKSMISSLVNSSVSLPTKIILDKSRHGSAEINARYQLPSKEMQHQARLAVFEKFEDNEDQHKTPEKYSSDLAVVPPDVKKSAAISIPIDDPIVDCKVVLLPSSTNPTPHAHPPGAPIHYYSHHLLQTPHTICFKLLNTYTVLVRCLQHNMQSTIPAPLPHRTMLFIPISSHIFILHRWRHHNKCTTPMLFLLLMDATRNCCLNLQAHRYDNPLYI